MGSPVRGDLDGKLTDAGELVRQPPEAARRTNVDDDEHGTRKSPGQLLEDLSQRVHTAGGRTDDDEARPLGARPGGGGGSHDVEA